MHKQPNQLIDSSLTIEIQDQADWHSADRESYDIECGSHVKLCIWVVLRTNTFANWPTCSMDLFKLQNYVKIKLYNWIS